MTVTGVEGSTFRLLLRQSLANPLDFSVIIGYVIPKSNRVFRLRRYNGRSTVHTNRLEGETFYEFHVHEATARYQDAGLAEDAFAQRTDRYADLQGAITCLMEDCGLEIPNDPTSPVQESALETLFPDEA